MEKIDTTETLTALTSELSSKIISYLGKDSTSASNLARLTGISRPSISKIRSAELSIERIAPSKIVKLIRLIEKDQPEELLRNYLKVLSSMNSIYSPLVSKLDLESFQSENTMDKVNKNIKDSDSFTVFILASNDKGTTTSEILEIVGKRGLSALDKLVEEELLKYTSEGKIVSNVTSGELFFDLDDEKRILSELLDHCNPRHKDQKRLFMWHYTNGVTREGLSQLQQATANYTKEVRKIFNENVGDIPAFYGTFMDTFVDQLITKGELQ